MFPRRYLLNAMAVLCLGFASSHGLAANVDVPTLVESNHPYANSVVREFVVRDLNAAQIQLHFAQLELAGGDTLSLSDVYGNEVVSYTNTGNLFDVTSPVVAGNTIKLKFTTDARITRYGFKVDRYSYAPLNPYAPTVIFEEYLPYDAKNYYKEKRVALQGEDMYATYLTPINSTVWSTDLAHWKFTDGGIVHEYTKDTDVSAYTVGMLEDNALVADQYNLFDTSSAKLTYLQTQSASGNYFIKPFQLASDNRGFVYAGVVLDPVTYGYADSSAIQILNTRTFSGNWEHTLPEASSLRYPEPGAGVIADRFYVDDLLMVLSSRTLYGVYDVSNPYQPAHQVDIYVGYDANNRYAEPAVANGYLFVSFNDQSTGTPFYYLSSFDLSNGYEMGYLELPEDVMKLGAYVIDANLLYAAGKQKIYVIDISNPIAMQVVDTIQVTYGPVVDEIMHLHKLGNRLYVMYKGSSYNSDGMTVRTIALPNNYLQ